VAEDGFPFVQRNRLVLHVSSSSGAVTTTAQPFDLPAAVALPPAADDQFPLVVAHGVLGVLRDRYQFVALRHEEEIHRLEELRVTGRGPVFLGQAFRLQREMSGASADLWRLKRVVQRLADGKVPFGGVDVGGDRVLDNLAGELEDVDREFGTLKENLKSLLELHMNVTSFEMNKFMKLLAIVGFLGLIPSVTGGLLGMNVAGNPWPVTLGQVAFVVMMAMALSLYVFAIKGWLR
jgi:Mg2+ and Co2+ transporter CorA